MHVRPVARQDVAHAGPEAAEADLPGQAQGAGPLQEVLPAWPLAKHVEGERAPRVLGFCQDFQQETVVLDGFKATDGDQIPDRLRGGLQAQWLDEIADDGRGNGRGLRKPAHERVPRPPGDVHKAVDLRDYLPFDLPDSVEYLSVAADLPLPGPFVCLGNPEVNCHDHTLVRSSACAQSRPGGQRILGVDDAVTGVGEMPPQRVAEEDLVPVPIPGNTRGPAASRYRETGTEYRDGQCPAPRERCDKCAAGTAFAEMPA